MHYFKTIKWEKNQKSSKWHQTYLFPIFFLHTRQVFSSVMTHFTCWWNIRSSWTYKHSGRGLDCCVHSSGQNFLFQNIFWGKTTGQNRTTYIAGICILQKNRTKHCVSSVTYPQELSLQQTLKHLVEAFPLGFLLQHTLEKHADLFDLSVCRKQIYSLANSTDNKMTFYIHFLIWLSHIKHTCILKKNPLWWKSRFSVNNCMNVWVFLSCRDLQTAPKTYFHNDFS